MTADEFNYVYVSNWGIYDAYFVYETYEGGKWINYKVPYAKTETNVTIDLANKVLVERDAVWVEVVQVAEVQTSLNSANEKIKELEGTLATQNETIKSLNSEKEGAVEKFNSASETVISLNSKVEELNIKVKEMKPLIDEYNKEQFEKSLNAVKEDYKAKFEKVGALDVFEKEETLELMKKTLNSKKEDANDAKYKLNQLIIDSIQVMDKEDKETNEPLTAKSINSIVAGKENTNLIDGFTDSYEENCGFSIN